MKKIILVGEAASGKTTIAEELERMGYRANLSVTTRPIRDGEEHMRSYNFMSKRKFWTNRILGRFWEVKKFNGWYYGTLKTEWIDKDAFVFTPGGVESMSNEDIENSVIWYIDVPEEVRRDRLMKRSDTDSVERRIEADRIDFSVNEKYLSRGYRLVAPGDFDVSYIVEKIIESAKI